MTATPDDIIRAAMQLSEVERLAIADRLLESVSVELPGLKVDGIDLIAELDRRSGDAAGSVSWEELRTGFSAGE